jgi:hypothetical protein
MTSAEREEIYGDRPWPDHYTFVPAIRVGNTVYIEISAVAVLGSGTGQSL